MSRKMMTVVLLACGLGVTGLTFSPRASIKASGTSLDLPAASHLPTAALNSPITLCDCYFRTDCRLKNSPCNYSSCLIQGKNDGRCDSTGAPPSSANSTPMSSEEKNIVVAERLALSSAVDSYFQGFLKAIENGGGHPDPKLVQAALDTHLSRNGHDRVELAVWVSLDAVMGWDFDFPKTFQRAEEFVGNIREVEGVSAAKGIVDAARRGLLDALKTGDDSRAVVPLVAFWSKKPNYIPRHLGRCYPHGHPEIPDMTAAIACQADVLQNVAGMLIETAHTEAARVNMPKEDIFSVRQSVVLASK